MPTTRKTTTRKPAAKTTRATAKVPKINNIVRTAKATRKTAASGSCRNTLANKAATARKPTTKATTTRKPTTKVTTTRKPAPKMTGSRAQTFDKLAVLAKEINVRLEKASKLEGDAFDHRLAAAIQLGSAKANCEEKNINFKKWCERHVKLAYDSARKLATVGQSNTPKLALEDLRARTAEAMRRNRTKGKTAKGKGAKDKSAKDKSAPKPNTSSAGRTTQSTAFDAAENAVIHLPAKAAVAVATTAALKHGYVVVTKDEASTITDRKRDPAKQLFHDWVHTLNDHERGKVVERMAEWLNWTVSYKADRAGQPKPASDNVSKKVTTTRKPATKAATTRTTAKRK